MAWMMEQATEVLASESVTETEERPSPLRADDLPPEMLHEPLDMEVVDLTVCQAENTAGYLRASGRLRIYEDLASQADTGANFRIEFVLVNLDTNEERTVAVVRTELAPNQLARQLQCDLPIPATGRYQVKALVRTVPRGEVVAESAGPTLRVDP